MKYKILLVGTNTSIITDLFMHKNSYLDFISSSLILQDLRNHVQYVQPDLFLYCMNDQATEETKTIARIREDLSDAHIPIAIIHNSPSDEAAHVSFPGGLPELSLPRPLTAASIQQSVLSFLNNTIREQFMQNSSINSDTNDLHDNELNSLLPKDTANLMKMIDRNIKEIEAENQPKKQILVIDDSANMLKTIKGHLDSKYEVATAISGKVARKYLSKNKVDLILLDYEMPDENGSEVFQSFAANDNWKNIPVVFLTAINDVKKAQKVLALKPQGYLLKPIEHELLLNKIQEVLGD